ncbi:MAG: hypothetical protein PHE06_05400 [Lachnospiraceae bacterium]|nr:hypothetical protein [Lachnospiraceae bacterium]
MKNELEQVFDNIAASIVLKPQDYTAPTRIYDRILERCAPILFGSNNYRTENAENTKNDIRELLSKEDSL